MFQTGKAEPERIPVRSLVQLPSTGLGKFRNYANVTKTIVGLKKLNPTEPGGKCRNLTTVLRFSRNLKGES